MENEEERIKKEIQEEIKDKELTKLMKSLFSFVVLGAVFGYIGFLFCSENGLDVQKGMTYGALFPIGLSILREVGQDDFISFIIYCFAYYIIVEKIPSIIGIVIIFAIIALYILYFIYISFGNKTKQVNKRYKYRPKKVKEVKMNNPIKSKEVNMDNSQKVKEINKDTIQKVNEIENDRIKKEKSESPKTKLEEIDKRIEEMHKENLNQYDDIDDIDDVTEDDDVINDNEEYYCIRCGEKITEEEDIDNGSLCEDCYAEVYFGERYKGDDYDLYK